MSYESAPSRNIAIRGLTKGPKFHWFGYYDKLQFDPTGRYVLGMEVDFEHRRPEPEDMIKIGMIDLWNDDEWIELGQSRAWCWQMGCMLQWRPGCDNEVMWNDCQEDHFVCHILNIKTFEKSTLPYPFFCLHPGGRLALGLDFERLEYMRPGYGYVGVKDRNVDLLAPDDMGIYLLDLETQEKKLIISLADLAAMPDPARDLSKSKHYCNCLLFNKIGERFVFLHRWRPEQGKGWPFKTRMISANIDGSELFVVVPGGCGHFNWKDTETLIVQDGGFSLYKDQTGRLRQIGEEILPNSGGHVSYLPGGEWIVGDTYADANRYQHLYLFDTQSKQMIPLGSFKSPLEYCGTKRENCCDDEWRCDLHPRISPNGKFITIDSPHKENGRQIYLVDVHNLIQ